MTKNVLLPGEIDDYLRGQRWEFEPVASLPPEAPAHFLPLPTWQQMVEDAVAKRKNVAEHSLSTASGVRLNRWISEIEQALLAPGIRLTDEQCEALKVCLINISAEEREEGRADQRERERITPPTGTLGSDLRKICPQCHPLHKDYLRAEETSCWRCGRRDLTEA